MLVVINLTSREVQLAVRNIEYSITLDGRCDFKCLLCHERDTDIRTVVEMATRYFSAIDIFSYDSYMGEKTWPRPQNYGWQEVARHIEQKYRLPWFWWEQDAVPLKPGWLTSLYEAHKAGGKVISGAVAQQNGLYYIAGVAIYPWNVSLYFGNALLTQAEAWDIMASKRDGILRRAHDITPFICHVPDRENIPFASSEDIPRLIPETAVIFHKNKDGSLLDVLQGRSASADASPSASHNIPKGSKYPSFTEQTDWPSGLFTFPTQLGVVCFYNCSIAEDKGQLWLFTRRHRHRIQDPMGELSDNASDLAIWPMRQNMTLGPAPILPTMPRRHPNEQFEDPRVNIYDGTCFVSFANWVHRKPWPGRQSFTRLTQDWRKVEVLWETPFGNNARKPELATGWEKNWVWFNKDDEWHCVYSINPHVVFKVDLSGTQVQNWANKPINLPWEYGEPRGGTPPVLIGDEYLCFFHSALMWQKPKRRYFMGAYTFNANPPFELLRFTPEPILCGSEEDFRVLGSPLVIFPNGSLLRKEDGKSEWLVTFGVNDENCGWIRIPHSDLEEQLTYVGRKRGLVSRMFEGATV